MAALIPKSRPAILILLGCVALSVSAPAQTATEPSPTSPQPTASPSQFPQAPAPSSAGADKPLPDVVTLMRDVEANQRKSEAVQRDYIYHSVATEQETDRHGQVKKTTVTESDVFWVNGVPVRRTWKKDGKPLSPDEIAKENERIDKIAAKANEKRDKADAQGKETDPRGNDEITVSRLLELGAFTNPRRVQLNGRDTIAVDFTGDPKAKTRNRAEDVIRDLAGTAWIDEQDHVLAGVEGHFVNSFKIGAGLVANIQKDTRFSMTQIKVNDEVWLPAKIEGQGSFHALLFIGFNGSGQIVNSDYRKFRATATVLPGVTQVGPPQSPEDHAQP
jgi:hypothetical protein